MSPNDHRGCGRSVGNALISLYRPKPSGLFHTEALNLPSVYMSILGSSSPGAGSPASKWTEEKAAWVNVHNYCKEVGHIETCIQSHAHWRAHTRTHALKRCQINCSNLCLYPWNLYWEDISKAMNIKASYLLSVHNPLIFPVFYSVKFSYFKHYRNWNWK